MLHGSRMADDPVERLGIEVQLAVDVLNGRIERLAEIIGEAHERMTSNDVRLLAIERRLVKLEANVYPTLINGTETKQ